MDGHGSTRALLVRAVDYGESDRIVTLLTSSRGKLGAIARGARRSKRRFSGALQPFQVIEVVLQAGRRPDLAVLVEAEVVRPFPRIPTDPARYAHASVAAELLRELTPAGERDPRPFALLEGYLEALDRLGPGSGLLAELLLSALTLGGLAPSLERCAACGRPAPPARAAMFDLARGIVCRSCGGARATMRGRVRAALLAATAGEALAGTAEADLEEGVLLLVEFVEAQLGRELRSASLLRATLGPAR